MKAIAVAAPAARSFQLTVGFARGQGKDTGTVFRLEGHFRVRWEEGLDKPVDVWRKELNIEPIRHGQNSWYEVLAGLEL